MLRISKAQVLHLVGALVVTPVAGFVSAWTAKRLPVHLTSQQIADAAYVGLAAGFGLALHYLRGWQVWERLEAKGDVVITEGDELDPRFAGVIEATAAEAGKVEGDAGTAHVA